MTKKTPHRLLWTLEGRVFLLSALMSLALVVFLYKQWVVDFEYAKTLIYAFIAHTFGGRAAGVGICIMDGISLMETFIYNFYLEVLIVCFTYSMVVSSLDGSLQFRWLRFLALKVMRKARRHKDKIERFGVIGLFLFVMAPLPVTGPVIGAIIGYLLKMRFVQNFGAVLGGTFVALLGWVYCFDFLENKLHVIQYILIGILVLLIISYIKTIKRWISNK